MSRKSNLPSNNERWRPWDHSTGPRTAAGKASVALNSLRHGLYSQDGLALNQYLVGLRRLLNKQKILLNQHQFIKE